MTPLRYAELFAGVGGFGLGFERAGWACAWHAEIDPVPCKALTHHWPDVPLYGDVRELDGRTMRERHGAVDILIGGSPCQDLSVAGKRAGLDGSRSSLFYEQMRVWDELGCDLCLWENVDGARSSNAGRDFAAVLSAFVGGAVPVPRRGTWSRAGVVAGPRGVAAWRVLDAQFFGVPQRRRRVFVCGTRAGRVDPAEILSLAEGVRGDSPQGREAGEGAPARAGDGAAAARVVMPCLRSNAYNNSDPGMEASMLVMQPLAFHHTQDPISGAVAPTLGVGADGMGVLGYTVSNSSNRAGWFTGDIIGTLCAEGNGEGSGFQHGVLAFDTTQITSPLNYSRPRAGDTDHPLAAGAHPPAVVTVTGEGVRHALTHEGHDASEDGTGRGTPVVMPAIPASGAGDSRTGNERTESDLVVYTTSIPRRLTPRECERLMGWPDDWSLPCGSDAARYRACGNGVASPVAEWIAWQLRAALALDAQEAA